MPKLLISGTPLPVALSQVDLLSAIDVFTTARQPRWTVRSVLGDCVRSSRKWKNTIERHIGKNFVCVGEYIWINPKSVLIASFRDGHVSTVTRYKETTYHGALCGRLLDEALISRARLTQIRALDYAKLSAASRLLPSGRLEILGRLTPVALEFMGRIAAQLRRAGWLTLASGVLVNPKDFTLLRDGGDAVELEFGYLIKVKDFIPADQGKIKSAVSWVALKYYKRLAVNPAKILGLFKEENLTTCLSVQCDDHGIDVSMAEYRKLRKRIGARFLPPVPIPGEETCPEPKTVVACA
jgi:hypothetical protein